MSESSDKWFVRWECKWRDTWIGVFSDQKQDMMHVWICLLPCLPIHIAWRNR